ncbi:PREDICTED: uncharacterized protein LOC108780770 [Cyphomyrmex costatus]|uniref:uncharacterized protein LOC108780770 n=1 Tax=Cyphomyrmex costatus TaxID=456900 RepID=UPI00085241BE|nr:PREDICTED: uncharacterized protein LOC108780770 [Cyphomyrmex costatus]
MYPIPGGSDRNVITCTKEEIFIILRNDLNESLPKQIEILEAAWTKKLNRNIFIHDDAKPVFAKFLHVIKKRWENSKTDEIFKKKYNNWLSNSIRIIIYDTEDLPMESKRTLECSAMSDRCKRRKTKELHTSNNIEELAYATQINVCSSEQLDASKVIKNVTLATPTIDSIICITPLTSEVERTLSDDAALSVLIEHKFSKRTYQSMRKISKENNCKLYPSYNNVLKAKNRCYPPYTSITITKCHAEIKLQALLDHTAKRILFFQREIIGTLTVDNARNMHLICKWGCDRRSGQNVYEQRFTKDGKLDENILFTSLVPLQLVCKVFELNTEVVVWKNPRPSSSRFSRPIRLQFLHKNVESTINKDDIEQQVKSLVPFTTQIHGMEICIKYSMMFTKIDNQVCNAMSNTKLTRYCYLCRTALKDFNNIDEILQKEITETNPRFGLSTLHVWIRFFECCLHLSYRLKIKKYQVHTQEEITIMEECKRIIQKGFRLQLGLVVDHSKPDYGNINDGNTAKRFFENSSISATITGVSECLINRFYVILQTISSGYNIKCDKFREYTLETARKFVELYPWYHMPISVHKLLIHGPEMITSALLSIGQLSENIQEARNHEDIKKFCEDFSRKFLRKNTMRDVFNWLIVISDPYISNIRKLPQKPLKSLSPEVIELLDSPTVHAATTITTNEKYTGFDNISSVINSDDHCDSDIDSDFCL